MRNARVSSSRLDSYRGRFHSQETELFDEICVRRADGKHVSCQWIQRQMRKLVKRDKPTGYAEFTASDRWRMRFFRRFVLSIRATTNTKSHTTEERIPLVRGFHKTIKLLQTHISLSDCSDHIYCRFPASCRFHVDQVTLEFGGLHN